MTDPTSDCPTGKVQYTRDGAKEAASALRARGRRASTYRCMQCECYHVGHRRRADKRKAIEGR